MTYCVKYHRPGARAQHHDFWDRDAAERWATLCRAGGWEAEVCEVPPTETAQTRESGQETGRGAPEGVGVAARGRDDGNGPQNQARAIQGDE